MEKIGRHLTFVWRFKHCAKCAHLFVSNRTSLQAIYSSCRLSYVQWAESGGARVVPVIIGRSRQYYEEVGQGSARGAPKPLTLPVMSLSNDLWQSLKSSDIWTKKLMAVTHFHSHDHVRVTPSFCSFLGPFYGPYLSRAKRSVGARL